MRIDKCRERIHLIYIVRTALINHDAWVSKLKLMHSVAIRRCFNVEWLIVSGKDPSRGIVRYRGAFRDTTRMTRRLTHVYMRAEYSEAVTNKLLKISTPRNLPRSRELFPTTVLYARQQLVYIS